MHEYLQLLTKTHFAHTCGRGNSKIQLRKQPSPIQ